MAKLFITIKEISAFSGFDGDIDNNTIEPFIFMAQNGEIKRVLGCYLYDKINNDIQNNVAFTGVYKEIYAKYVVPLLSYYTCAFYLRLGVPKVSQKGVYLVAPEQTEQIFNEKTDQMASRYEKIAGGLELDLIAYLGTINIPEWVVKTKAKNPLNWIKL